MTQDKQLKPVAEMAEFLRSCGSETGDEIAAALEAQAAVIELAYGLLWLAPTDRATRCGELAYQARQVLLAVLDREAKLRGVKAAQDMLPPPESRKNSQTIPHATEMFLRSQQKFPRD